MDDTKDSPVTPTRMARITSIVRACADTISDLTSEQCDIINRLGVDTVDLFLGMIHIALESGDQPNSETAAGPTPNARTDPPRQSP